MPFAQPSAASPIAAALALCARARACCTGLSLTQSKARGYEISEDAVKQIRAGQSAALVTAVLGSPQATNALRHRDRLVLSRREGAADRLRHGAAEGAHPARRLLRQEEQGGRHRAARRQGRQVFDIETRRTPSYGQDRTFLELIISSIFRFDVVDRLHDIDSTMFQALGGVLDIEGINAMPHHNSVLHGLLKYVPWSKFEALVETHQTDARVRRLSTRSQLVALLYGQLAGAASLREIETAMASHAGGLYHLGARQVSRSTLADANGQRSHAVFSGLFAHMAGMAGRGFRRSSADAVRLIDSTGIRL